MTQLRALASIARTGITATLLNPLRSAVSIGCLLSVLVPYLAGTGLSQGIEEDARASIRWGADLYVSGEQLGRSVPIPLSIGSRIRSLPGVTAVVPRIVGTVALGREGEAATVVGLPAASLPPGFRWVEGRVFRDGATNEIVVGTELARALGLHPGSVIPPFYHNPGGDRLSVVVGVFRPEVSLWQSRMILTSFGTASAIFSQKGTAGEMLVYCRPEAAASVQTGIQRLALLQPGTSGVRCRIMARSDLEQMLPAGVSHLGGLFLLHYLLAFAAAVLVLVVSSGIGLPDRRREIGVLKATGWQTDEILVRGAVESVLVSVAAASLALILAFVWLRVLNGCGLAALLLPGADWSPSFQVPCRLAPLPALLGLLYSWAIVATGTLWASWRAAIVPPREALR